jgi:crotonobetainyl-CoA:carnitine CoA-transferase CaiB-like acyl-CoA transferase
MSGMASMDTDGPLAGIRVVDFTIALSGPLSTTLLGDQGASIVKVERPGMGDIARWTGMAVNGVTAVFLAANRGKRSIAIDLQSEEGREIALSLVERADVVVQNFRPGVMDKLGLGYGAARARNPNVIYVSVSGYGSSGPYHDRSAYDTSIQGYAGFAANQAGPDGAPKFLHQLAADKVTALFAAQAISAALFARERGAGGQHIELSMADAVVSFLWVDSAGNEVLMDADGSKNSAMAAGFEPIRFIDGWGIVAPTSAADFTGMCRAFGVEGHNDPRVATIEQRRLNRDFADTLVDMCHAHASNMTKAQATSRLEAERVPFSIILHPSEIIVDPHAVATGMFEEGVHPVAGRVRLPRHPILYSETPARLGCHAPRVGEHTDAILEELGRADEIGRLRAAGVVA